jgi:hypothetical protein
MNPIRTSLRVQIEKWFGPVSRQALRITRMGHSSVGGIRCVMVEGVQPNESCTVVFFRHNDGSWRLYPPETPRPSMCTYPRAA